MPTNNVYLLGQFGEHAEAVVDVLREKRFLVYNPETAKDTAASPEAAFLDDLEAMQRADVFLVSVDEAERPYFLLALLLKLIGGNPKRSPRTHAILTSRVEKMTAAVADPKLAWYCGWAYGTGKILVTFSVTGATAPVPRAVVAHVDSLESLAEVAEELSKVCGDGVQQATVLKEIREKYAFRVAS